ncbi:unnamed protein product [Leuciscus chuanchicus]
MSGLFVLTLSLNRAHLSARLPAFARRCEEHLAGTTTHKMAATSANQPFPSKRWRRLPPFAICATTALNVNIQSNARPECFCGARPEPWERLSEKGPRGQGHSEALVLFSELSNAALVLISETPPPPRPQTSSLFSRPLLKTFPACQESVPSAGVPEGPQGFTFPLLSIISKDLEDDFSGGMRTTRADKHSRIVFCGFVA